MRDRADDIPLLLWRFIAEFGARFGKQIKEVPADNMAALQRYPWPGNVRELRNAVERAMILATGPRLTFPIPSPLSVGRRGACGWWTCSGITFEKVLEAARWRVRGRGGAADQLGFRPTTLETRMAKLGLTRPKAS